jgi:hypothetical protein
MTPLEQAVERAVDDIIVEVTAADPADAARWRRLEAAATRLHKAARELRSRSDSGTRR